MIEIKILKWEDYQCRKDIKKPWWMKISNQLVTDPDLGEFDNDELIIWIFLLSIASIKRSGRIFASAEYIGRQRNVPQKKVLDAFKKLSDLRMIHITRTESVRDPIKPVTSEKRREEKRRNTTSLREVVSTTAEASLQTVGGCHPDLKGDPENEKFLGLINLNTQERWLKLYPVEYVDREVTKALNWLENSPQRRPRSPRGLSSFMTKWLDRGFERWRKQQPVNEKSGAQRAKEMMDE